MPETEQAVQIIRKTKGKLGLTEEQEALESARAVVASRRKPSGLPWRVWQRMTRY
jgi:hypothetical protein